MALELPPKFIERTVCRPLMSVAASRTDETGLSRPRRWSFDPETP